MSSDGRSIAHDALESMRFAAVRLHREGVSIETLSRSFKVTRSAIHNWIKRARDNGINCLRATKGTGRPSTIDEKQFKSLVHLMRQPATRHGYSTDLWSGPRVRNLIRREFGVEYHRKHMPRLLRKLGLVLKFPERRALEQDPAALRKWKKERFPEISKFAKKKKALVFFADECLISLVPYIGKTWTQPKTTPIVRVSGKRHQHVGVTAAINAQSRFTFELTRKDETFTAHVFLRFIRKLRREHPRRFIILIVDGARPHIAKSVKEFVAQNVHWLRLEFLPAYSPELNPSEKPWRYIKTKKMNANQARNKIELRQKAKTALCALKKDTKTLASFFD